ncbi:hypothetical protein V5799_015981 [Amblyomma americanum]|uniref:Uncharacterized protein n=1 Tax=Amblyomma americanum TaxID=6943 RepID=A0AAQ4F7R5_AMBAM
MPSIFESNNAALTSAELTVEDIMSSTKETNLSLGPSTKLGKRKGNLPDDVPVELRRSRSQEGEDAGALIGTSETRKRKPEVLFTDIDCTVEEEQVVRELGGAVAAMASDCTHLITD